MKEHNKDIDYVIIEKDDTTIFICRTYEKVYDWLEDNGYKYSGISNMFSSINDKNDSVFVSGINVHPYN